MTSTETLTDRSLWLLSTINSVPHVEGKTRLQKYMLLVSKIILKDKERYDGWESDKYGAFCKQIFSDVEHYTRIGLVNEVMRSDSPIYSLTENGVASISSHLDSRMETYKKITEITNFYFNRPLWDLLADSYVLYPEYTTQSVIKDKIRKTLSKRAAEPSSQYKIPFTDITPDLSVIDSTENTMDFPYNDEDMRRKICDMIGLDSIPKIDPSAFKELEGMFKDIDISPYENAVDLVRSVRGYH